MQLVADLSTSSSLLSSSTFKLLNTSHLLIVSFMSHLPMQQKERSHLSLSSMLHLMGIWQIPQSNLPIIPPIFLYHSLCRNNLLSALLQSSVWVRERNLRVPWWLICVHQILHRFGSLSHHSSPLRTKCLGEAAARWPSLCVSAVRPPHSGQRSAGQPQRCEGPLDVSFLSIATSSAIALCLAICYIRSHGCRKEKVNPQWNRETHPSIYLCGLLSLSLFFFFFFFFFSGSHHSVISSCSPNITLILSVTKSEYLAFPIL